MGFRRDILSFAQKIPPWLVNLVVSAFILKDKKLLLVRQRNHTHWTPPGGLIDFGEDLKKALFREVKEEIGVKIKILGILSPIIRWRIDEENRVLVIFNFLGKIDGGRLTKVDRNDEGDVAEFAWVGLSDWDKYEIAPQSKKIFEEALRSDAGTPKISYASQQEPMQLAAKIALKSGCLRGKRGVVVVKNGKVLLSSHNQVWPREDYCQKRGCIRDEKKLGLGKNLEVCDSIHAEANLIAQAARKGINLNRGTLYSTCLPCAICARLVVFSGIKKIFYLDKYGDEEAKKILRQGKVALERVNLPGDEPSKRLRDTEGQ